VWDPIIDEVTFNRVKKILAKNKSRKKPHSKERYPYILSGLTYCMTCGDVCVESLPMEMLERKREIYKRELEYAAQFDETIWGMPVEFKTFRKFCDSLGPLFNRATPELLSKIASKLIYKVEIGPDSVKVHYFADQGHFEALERQEALHKMMRETKKEQEKQKNAGPGGVGTPLGVFAKNLMCVGSNSLTNGAPERT
jgi:hypothetical protein